jgi:hypothetical protein
MEGKPITEDWLKKAKFSPHSGHYRLRIPFPFTGTEMYLVAQKGARGWFVNLMVNGLCASDLKHTIEEVRTLHKAIKG